MDKAPEEISLYDVILGMEGIIKTGEICGVPSDEVSKEMLMLKNEYRKVDCMLERVLKEITLARILFVSVSNVCLFDRAYTCK